MKFQKLGYARFIQVFIYEISREMFDRVFSNVALKFCKNIYY